MFNFKSLLEYRILKVFYFFAEKINKRIVKLAKFLISIFKKLYSFAPALLKCKNFVKNIVKNAISVCTENIKAISVLVHEKYKQNKEIFISYIAVIAIFFYLIYFILKLTMSYLPESKKYYNINFETLQNEQYTLAYQCQSAIEPVKIVNISSELNSKIQKILVSEGDYVKQGDILAVLDNKDRKEKDTSAKSNYVVKLNEYKAAQESYQKKLISESEFEFIKAQFNEFKSQYENAKKYSNAYFILAPFNGYISKIYLQEGSVVNFGSKIIKIVDHLNLKLNCYVPYDTRNKISKQNKVVIKYNNKNLESFVEEMSVIGEQETGLYRIKIHVNKSYNFRPFKQVEVAIEKDSITAYKTTLNVISVENNKTFVKIIDEDGKVAKKEVQIVDQDDDSIYINGLFSGENIILKNHKNFIAGNVYQYKKK